MDTCADPNGRRAFRLAVADLIAPVCAGKHRCMAVFVGGSVASGWSDDRSDLGLGLFWSELLAETTRCRLARGAGGRDIETSPSDRDPGMANDECVLDEVKIDLVHATVATVDALVSDVERRHGPTPWKHEVMSTLQSAIPLTGAGVLAAWQAGLDYPRLLARIMIEQIMVFGPRAFLETLMARGDFLLLRELLGRIERQLPGMLLALNRVFTPSALDKWSPRIVAQLAIKPPDFLERARRVWFLPDDAAFAEAHTLIDDVFALVEGTCPGIDTGPAPGSRRDRSMDEAPPPWVSDRRLYPTPKRSCIIGTEHDRGDTAVPPLSWVRRRAVLRLMGSR